MGEFDGVRDTYDLVADEYTARFYHELQHKPFDCALLDRFASMVESLGPACDLGCGPGQIARYLADRGLRVTGVDISHGMVAVAQRLNPDIDFLQGSMLDLPFENDSLGGLAAFYSVIHIPRGRLPEAFAEMRRVLKPDGVLLVSFHIGNEARHLDDWFGKDVSIDFHFFTQAELKSFVTEAGFSIDEVHQRPPYAGVEAETQRGYIVAQKLGQ
ncbi:MAG: class I SAM-dependent methyltransferase [Chloroflexota bacterium]